MDKLTRRGLLQGGAALGAAAATGALDLAGFAKAWAADNPFTPEAGAELNLLRWKRFVQSEEDAFMAIVDAFTKQTGIKMTVANESLDDVQPKASVAANVGQGPDLVWGLYSLPHLFPQKLVDMTDVADHLGGKYGGWVETAVTYGTNGGKWIAIPIAFNGNYINYRKSMVEAAGFSGGVPGDTAGFLELCKALQAKGTPAGMALGRATGDGNAWVHWALWAHGGTLTDKDGNISIESPETEAALEYVKQLYDAFIPGCAAWNDANNNKAFLGGEVSLTNNGISIYAKAVADGMDMAADIDHALWPEGPVGKPTEFHIAYPMMIFQYSKYPMAAKAFTTFLMEATQFDQWLKGAVGYLTHPLNAYDANPVWTDDPKHTVFRDAAKRTLWAGYPGPVGEKAAAALADFIVLDMFANYCTGRADAKGAMSLAARSAQRIYR